MEPVTAFWTNRGTDSRKPTLNLNGGVKPNLDRSVEFMNFSGRCAGSGSSVSNGGRGGQ